MTAFVLSLWAVSNPLAGTVALATAVVVFAGSRRAYRLIRCLHVCRELTVDLGGRVEISIVRTHVDESR